MGKEEILELFRITDEKVARIHEETEAKIAVLRTQSEQYRRESELYRRDTDKALRRVSQHIGGHTKTVADIAEEYFYRSLKGHPKLANIHFDEVLWDQEYGYKQYDIIMRNKSYVALVSVKTAVKEQAVTNLVKFDLPALKDFYAQEEYEDYKNAKFIGVVAGLTCKKRALKKANELGILVLTQSENNQAKIVNAEITPTVF